MEKNKMPLLIGMVLVAVLCIGIAFFVGGGEKPAVSEAEMFNKTKADFPEDRFIVEFPGTSEDGKENFIVYKEGVFSIASDHVLDSNEEGDYVVTAEDKAMEFAQKGDMFFIEASSQFPDGVIAKITEVKREGDRVVLSTTSEGLVLSDLIEYAYVDTKLSLEEMGWLPQELPEGVTVSMEDAESLEFLQKLHGKLAEQAAESLTSKARTQTAPPEGQWDIAGKVPRVHIEVPKMILEASGYSQENAMKVDLVVTELQLVFKFSPDHNYLAAGVRIDKECLITGEAGISGNREDEFFEFPAFEIPIPYTPFKVEVEGSLKHEVEGSIKGEYEYGNSGAFGMIYSISSKGTEAEQIEGGDSYFDMDASLEGEYTIGPNLEAVLKVAEFVDLYAEGFAGVKVAAEEGEVEEAPAQGSDSYHACKLCYEGKAAVELSTNGGVKPSEVGEKIVNFLFGGLELQVELFEYEKTLMPLKDFYIAFPDGVMGDFDFGWGSCPNHRYKVVVSVQNGSGNAFSDVDLSVTLPNGSIEEGKTDEKGNAVFYLPDGENYFSAEVIGQSAGGTVKVEGAPTTGSVKLRDYVPKMYINLIDERASSDEALVEYLKQKYPDAIILTHEAMPNSEFVKPGDIGIDIEAHIEQKNPADVWENGIREYKGACAYVQHGFYYITGSRYLMCGDDSNLWTFNRFRVNVAIMTEPVGDQKRKVHYILPLDPSQWSMDIGINYDIYEWHYDYDENFRSPVWPESAPTQVSGLLPGLHMLHSGTNAAEQVGSLHYWLIDTISGVETEDKNFTCVDDFIQMMLDEADDEG